MDSNTLLSQIRSRHRSSVLLFLLLTAMLSASAVWLYLYAHPAGLLCLLPAALCVFAAVRHLLRMCRPQKSPLFRKYGSPERVAEMLQTEGNNIFFENSKMLVSQHWLAVKNDPERFVRFEWILLAYSRSTPRGIWLTVHDCWGSKLTFPFAVGEQQVFRPEIILDKIKKNAPGCQLGCTKQHLDYARSHRRKLPEI
ncbi:MAG: hypothetical protein IKQ39_08480 [Oscillospiraceae bacterium]|nr:hypothetical protein [Oscillospiraceae bacterium]